MPMLHEFNIIIYSNALFLMKQKETLYCVFKVFNECIGEIDMLLLYILCIPMKNEFNI